MLRILGQPMRPLATVRTIQLQRHLSSEFRMPAVIERQIKALQEFSACDVSDALLKLQKPAAGRVARAGYLADIVPYAPSSPFAHAEQPKVVAPASTLQLIDKIDTRAALAEDDPASVPKGKHWADLVEPGTVLVVDQPRHQTCASVGGIMASRMKVRGVAGCVVSGRVRDITEMRKCELPIWAAGKSTVGVGGESKVYAQNVPIYVNEVQVNPGDIVFCDPLEGVVVIPQELVDQVIDLVPKLVEADDKVKADVEQGATVYESFKNHRG